MVRYKGDSQIFEHHNYKIMQKESRKKGHISQPTYLDYTHEPRQQRFT